MIFLLPESRRGHLRHITDKGGTVDSIEGHLRGTWEASGKHLEGICDRHMWEEAGGHLESVRYQGGWETCGIWEAHGKHQEGI